jgi:hypothetical protein
MPVAASLCELGEAGMPDSEGVDLDHLVAVPAGDEYPRVLREIQRS